MAARSIGTDAKGVAEKIANRIAAVLVKQFSKQFDMIPKSTSKGISKSQHALLSSKQQNVSLKTVEDKENEKYRILLQNTADNKSTTRPLSLWYSLSKNGTNEAQQSMNETKIEESKGTLKSENGHLNNKARERSHIKELHSSNRLTPVTGLKRHQVIKSHQRLNPSETFVSDKSTENQLSPKSTSVYPSLYPLSNTGDFYIYDCWLDHSLSTGRENSARTTGTTLPIFRNRWQKSTTVDANDIPMKIKYKDIIINIPPHTMSEKCRIHQAAIIQRKKIRQMLKLSDEDIISSVLVEFHCRRTLQKPVSVILPHQLPRDFNYESVFIYHIDYDFNKAVNITRIPVCCISSGSESSCCHGAEKPGEKRKRPNDEEQETSPKRRKDNINNTANEARRRKDEIFDKQVIQNVKFMGSNHIEIFTKYPGGLFCVYRPTKTIRINQAKLSMYAETFAEVSDDGNIDIRVMVWDGRVTRTDSNQVHKIQRSGSSKIHLHEDSIGQSVLSFDLKGNVLPRLDISASEVPSSTLRHGLVKVPIFLPCQKCSDKTKFKTFEYKWAMKFPTPAEDQSTNSGATSEDITVEIVHETPDCLSLTKTTVSLKVQNPHALMKMQQHDTVRQLNQFLLRRVTENELKKIASFLQMPDIDDQLQYYGQSRDLRQTVMERCGQKNQDMVAQAILRLPSETATCDPPVIATPREEIVTHLIIENDSCSDSTERCSIPSFGSPRPNTVTSDLDMDLDNNGMEKNVINRETQCNLAANRTFEINELLRASKDNDNVRSQVKDVSIIMCAIRDKLEKSEMSGYTLDTAEIIATIDLVVKEQEKVENCLKSMRNNVKDRIRRSVLGREEGVTH